MIMNILWLLKISLLDQNRLIILCIEHYHFFCMLHFLI